MAEVFEGTANKTGMLTEHNKCYIKTSEASVKPACIEAWLGILFDLEESIYTNKSIMLSIMLMDWGRGLNYMQEQGYLLKNLVV